MAYSTMPKLFGVKMETTDGLALVWHKDVLQFSKLKILLVSLLPIFTLNPCSRPSKKRKGAWRKKVWTIGLMDDSPTHQHETNKEL